jgi:hypothetical protein
MRNVNIVRMSRVIMQEIARHFVKFGCYQLALHFWMYVCVNVYCTNRPLSRVDLVNESTVSNPNTVVAKAR